MVGIGKLGAAKLSTQVARDEAQTPRRWVDNNSDQD